MVKAIPDRWANYSNMGRQIPGTRFIAFKVPLKDAVLRKLPSTVVRFGPRDLMDHCSALGLIIDLTNTDRYYDTTEFLSQNIKHKKIKTEGHKVPKKFVVQQFFTVVEKFLEANSCNDKLIGVHCTHGVNRTGYLICRYMIQQLGVPPDQAISDFNSARGHDLERANYLEHLRLSPWLNNSSTPRSNSSTPRNNSSTPSSEGRKQKRRSTKGSAFVNPTLEGVTPPYMPHQSRRKFKQSNGASSHESRLSKSPFGRKSSQGTSPDCGWSSFGRGKHQQNAERSLSMSKSAVRRRRKKSAKRASTDKSGDDNESEKFKSPVFGKLYYEQYYKGQVLPQYDAEFYTKGGGGVGPYRPNPRQIPRTYGEGKRKKVYKGPRPYKTPPKPEEPFQESLNEKTPGTKHRGGSRRNTFSPGANSDVFSPENEGGRRKSNNRFQPY